MPRAEILSKQALYTLTQPHAELAGKIETFPATFFLACIAALELEGVALEEI